jgi:glyoxylase-like metal-dependent hydrolase (beta-lactamase superfamily II)
MRKQMQSAELRALLPADFEAHAYHIRGTTASLTVCDTDKIDLGGRILHVLHTPGHSAGHVAYLDADSGTLFSGDTAYAGPMYACFKGSDPAAFAMSAHRLAGLAPDVRCIAPGHNQALSDSRFLSDVASAADSALRSDTLSLPYNDFVSGLEFRARDFSIFLPRSQADA